MSSVKDINSEVRSVVALNPQSITANTNGNIVDLAGSEAAMLEILVGAVVALSATDYFAVKIQSGNDSAGADMADVAAGDYFGARDQAGAAWNQRVDSGVNAGAGNFSLQLGFMNTEVARYARVVLTKVGNPTSALCGGALVLGGRRVNP